MVEPYVQIAAVLPVCLHLDERVFASEWNGIPVELSTRIVANKEGTWLGTGQNVEVDSDSFSHFRFSLVTVRFPHTRDVPLQKALDAYADVFFGLLNHFLACCRITLNRHGLREVHSYDHFLPPIDVTYGGPDNQGQHHIALVKFGDKGIVSLIRNRTEDEHQELQRLFRSEVPLSIRFLSDARRHAYYRDAIHAVVSGVIALEIEVADTIRAIGRAKGVSGEDVDSFIKDVGITGNIKTTLRLLAPDDVVLPDEAVFGGCKGAITVRNAVVHKGRRDVVLQEVRDWLEHIETMIGFCKKLRGVA